MNIGTIVVIAVIVVIVIMAVVSGAKHFKGEGGCCGGGGEIKTEKKTLEGKVIAKKKIIVEGMQCDNCKAKVERAIDSIDGAVGRVDLKNKTAYVEMDRAIDNNEFIRAIRRYEFKVSDIIDEEV